MKQSIKYWNTHKNQHGFLSIEVIIVLVVVLGLLALGAANSGMLSTNSNTVEEMSNIQTLYVNTKGLKSSQGYGTSGTDLSSQLIALKGIPSNMSIIANTIYNSFNGVVTIASTGTGFTISTSFLPSEVCLRLVTKISRTGSFETTEINANAPITSEVTPADAATQCNSKSNTVTWTSIS
jgi:type II secretory pathway pseudopilin PulG